MSVRSTALVLALVGLLLAACTGDPAVPRPTPRDAAGAIVVAPEPDPTPRPRRGKPTPTPRPRAMSDAEWRVAFCKTQDVVFALEFAFGYAIDMAGTGNLEAFKRSIRTLGNRAERARKTLRSVPARYARPLVAVEFAFLRSVDQLADRGLAVLRHPTMSGLRSLKTVAKRADRQWDQMVRVNRRMHESKHRLVCL